MSEPTPLTYEQARKLRREIPDQVYAEFGSLSGADDSWLLLKILHELREVRALLESNQDTERP